MSTQAYTFRERAEAAIARRVRARNPPPEPERVAVTSACPDSRETTRHRLWPRRVLDAFAAAEVINTPVSLYDDLPESVTPARPLRS